MEEQACLGDVEGCPRWHPPWACWLWLNMCPRGMSHAKDTSPTCSPKCPLCLTSAFLLCIFHMLATELRALLRLIYPYFPWYLPKWSESVLLILDTGIQIPKRVKWSPSNQGWQSWDLSTNLAVWLSPQSYASTCRQAISSTEKRQNQN